MLEVDVVGGCFCEGVLEEEWEVWGRGWGEGDCEGEDGDVGGWGCGCHGWLAGGRFHLILLIDRLGCRIVFEDGGFDK